MPFARRTALVLALGLMTVAASAAPAEVRAEVKRGASGHDPAVVARHDSLQAASVRLEREHRRESLRAHRSVKHLLIVAVLFVALLAASRLGLRPTVAGGGLRPPLTSWWFRSRGRAPPYLQLSVI